MSDSCRGNTRRSFLADCGMGFTGLALGAMMFRDGIAKAEDGWLPPDGKPHFTPKAKSVIWLFMGGGVSHLEGFDPKPALNRYAGMKISDTPYKDTLKASFLKDNVRKFVADSDAHGPKPVIYPLQVGYRRHGKSGIEVSDWWPHVGSCVD